MSTPDEPDREAVERLGERWAAVVDGEPERCDGLQLQVARERIRQTMFAARAALVRLGRYVVLGRLGAGGMGAVYAAYDPELDRRIALKLVHRDTSAAARRRLLREAQVLAKLMHPNVVAVHDVGTIDAGPVLGLALDGDSNVASNAGNAPSSTIFIAMEYVDGSTLRSWLAQGARTWPEVLDTLLQAARGLAAAHAVGVVHRDLKPDNVMIGRDGRPRVMDFGLARIGMDAEDVETGPSDRRSRCSR